MKSKSFSALSLVLLLSVVLVSCSKSAGYNASNPTPPAPPMAGAVSIVNMSFDVASITVAVGATITWTNNDNMTHTVTADNGSFDSGNIAVGAKFAKMFSTAGTYTYHCTIHPTMKGTVIVK